MPPNEDNSHYEKILATGEVKCIDDEIPFEIPKSWEWVRVKMLGDVITGSTPPTEKKELYGSDYPFFKPADLGQGLYTINSKDSVSILGFENSRKVTSGSVLITCIGATIGKTGLVRKDGICNQQINAIIPLPYFSFEYIYFACISSTFQEQIKRNASSTTLPILNKQKFETLLLPIPPFSEQQNIVAKLKEILPIIENYNTVQVKLDTLNGEINNLLKKSILQEAIQGRLVPQIDSEESATVLLEKIKEEKSRLVKEGKLKKKDLTDSTIFKGDDNKYYEKCGIKVTCIDNEIAFTIPESWQWARLGELITTKTGLAYSKPNLEIKSNKMVRVLRGGNITNGSWQMKADDVMISSEFVKPELYLRKGYFITPAVTSWENMGKTALVRECYEDVVVGGFVLMMCPFYIDSIFEEYLNYFFQSTLFQQYCRSITNKSGQAFYNLSRNKLLQLLVPIPPVKEQQRIYHKLNDALASIMSR